MKKILLINSNIEKAPYPVPPLGLCLLQNSLKDKYNVLIYDGVFNEEKNLRSTLKSFNPDYIGISIRNIDNLVLKNTIEYVPIIIDKYLVVINEFSSTIPIILGGSGFSIYPVELMKLFNADYGVVGEGEDLFRMLLSYLDENKEVPVIDGLISKKNTESFTLNCNYLNFDKNEFSQIDKKIDFQPYISKGVYSIQSKRGCYHSCIYCTYPFIEGKKYRLRDPKDIADEIEEVSKRFDNITFEFVDSTFNDPKGHAEKICKSIINKNLRVNLRTMGINPKNVTVELFDLMKNAGFKQIDCTPDTASKKMLKNMKKNFNLSELIRTAEIINKKNLPTMWFFIFGGPGETEETVNETFNFIKKYINKLDMVHATIGLRIYPNTELQKIAINEKVIDKNDSLLKPVFYISNEIGLEKLSKMIKEFSLKTPNFVPNDESKPDEELIKQTITMRKSEGLDEPMFRSFLKMRYKNLKK